jgi:hypothetical protein
VVESTEPVASVEPVSPAAPIAPIGAAPVRSRPGWVKPLIAIAAFVVVLTVASTAAVLVVGGPGPSNYAAGTPQAAFQNFVDATQRSDWVTANSLLSASMKDRGMDAQSAAGFLNVSGTTVSIESSSGDANRMTLYFSYGSSAGMPPYSAYGMSSSVDMVRESDGWKLDSQVGPGGK